MKKLFKGFCILLFVLAGILDGYAQYNQPLSDYVIKVWSAEEGLPTNNLRHIAKDKDGFLWISTFNGLVRFDGNKFKTFDAKNVPDLSTSVFYSVLPMANGSMYVSTQSSGLLIYDNLVFSKLPDAKNEPTSIQTTFLDSRNRLWIGTRNNGVYYFENDKFVRFNIPGFNTKSIINFIEDSLGMVWVASEGAGIAKIDRDDSVSITSTKDGLLSNITSSILFYDNKVYVGTEKGLSIFENGKWTSDARFNNFYISNIVKDVNNSLWFTTNRGLIRLSNKGKVEFLTENNGLPSRQVSSIAFDDENNIWLTTRRGLVQLKLSNFKNFTKQEGLSNRGVNVIEEGLKGTFYVGTDNGDVDVIKNGVITKLAIKKDLTYTSIKDIFADDDGTLWIATYDGLIKKNGSAEEYFKVKDGLLSNKTRRILKDSKGIIWIASRNGGINKILLNGTIESIGVKNGLGSDFAFSIDETPDGRIIIGTADGGLNIIYPNGKIDILNPRESIIGLSIFNVYIKNDNQFWLATNVGLYCYKNKKFTLVNLRHGLPVETIFDIKEDESGDLWGSTIMGLVRISKEDIHAFLNGKLNKITPSLLNDSDGMVTRKCAGATKMLMAKDGKLWIPTIKGVTVLDPSKLIVNLKEPKVFIEELLVDDEKVTLYNTLNHSIKKRVIIKPGHRNYVINYTSLSMYSPEKVKFSYKLEGFDDEWVEIGASRSAKYTNIPYGTYTFKVIAANNSGVWSADYAQLNIVIKPFIYETTWFIVVLILGFVLITVLIYNYQTKAVNNRNRELLKLNAELDSFAYSVSHDLKAPLSSIQGLLNVARIEGGENAMEYYNRIDKSVSKLDSFIKDIIDYSKNSRLEVRKEFVNVKSVVIGIFESLAFLNREKEIETELDVADHIEVFTDKTRFLFIINNLLTNAFRYADFDKNRPFIKIRAKVEEQTFYLDIEDNGQGIKKELQDKIYGMFYRANEKSSGSGLGLYIVKESLIKLNGTIEIKSEYKVGTTVHVKIPL